MKDQPKRISSFHLNIPKVVLGSEFDLSAMETQRVLITYPDPLAIAGKGVLEGCTS